MFSYIRKQHILLFLAGGFFGTLFSTFFNGDKPPVSTVDAATQTSTSLTEYVVVEYV
jgi:hypothetical protein